MTPMEALADAIMQYEGWHRDSRSWRNRNPGNLRAYGSRQLVDADGYRIFDSLWDGFQALLDDLWSKFKGSHGLTPSSSIFDLISVYAPASDNNKPELYAEYVCRAVSLTLGRHITPTTTLGDYINGSSG